MHAQPTVESRSTAIQRDYWKLAMAAAEGAPSHVLIQGRRRNTEGYWPGLQLPLSLFERLRRAVHQSCRVADAYPMTPVVALTWFPTRELLAVCHGPGYVLELAECYDGRGKRSLDIVISDPASGLRPRRRLFGRPQGQAAVQMHRPQP